MFPPSSGYKMEDFREMLVVCTKRHGVTAQ